MVKSLFLLFPFFSIVYVLCSRGNELPEFKNCVSACVALNCREDAPRQFIRGRLSLVLRIGMWDCQSECDYSCQRIVTLYRKKNGLQKEQFWGKWYFIRILAMQEPASVVFSILNGYVHYLGFCWIKLLIPSDYVFKKFYIIYALLGLNTWFWSAVYHIRDFKFTERADYFSAGALTLWSFFFTPLRIFRLDLCRNYNFFVYLWAFTCIFAFLIHVIYLSFVKFNYSYNMAANVLIGFSQNILWVYYSLSNYGTRPFALWPMYIVCAIMIAMCFEIFDFPPILYLFDAHSLWHMATIPIVYYWYKFLILDSNFESKNVKGVQEAIFR
ncbi:hypothetical protein PNEG_03552 [Pneumocystis murina B123]|uniref:Post-GPI attachment to proteins factor 3 n=1 Tax=Pneumocystis murina (strain B123) TaxID=1069680 RepID=M7PCB0_PNEMU|nr:hypothetical protein PNEG_03552 [Pneumocystis murina B123]EMR08114.1 hypothetical protein PNEG_03552 [Pneumocystis murina B123]